MTHDSLMVFDTASLYFRAFFGVPGTVRGPDATPTNAVRGLLDMITRLIGQYRPSAVACAWDNDWRPPWRVELVPGYKAHRLSTGPGVGVIGAGGRGALSGESEEAPDDLRAQVPIIRDVLDAAGVPVLGVDGYEADDVLATLARRSQAATLVVTGDRDLFQLASEATTILYVARGVAKHELVDPSWVREHYGVPPERYVDFAVLRGDPSDGLPGVPGVGEKTAAQLVAAWGDLDAISAAVADPDTAIRPAVRARMLGAADYLPVARRVVAVVDDLTLPEVSLRREDLRPHPDRLAELARRYGLDGPIGRLTTALGPGA